MNNFEQIYLNILNEESSPTTFTPEELLYDTVKECFYSTGEFIVYKIDEILGFCDDLNKPLFTELAKNIKYNDDYAIIIVYFPNIEDIDYIFSKNRYLLPHHHYGFSLNKVKNIFKKFFADERHIAGNFNSIDICPELGCIIGLNGSNIKTNRDFEKELDHELNHYFEGMEIHYKQAEKSEKIKLDQEIINELLKFYKINISKVSFINDLKKHLFHEDEFRSMNANVFHEILRYNETHLKQLETDNILNDILTKNWKKYKDKRFQEMLLFSWICNRLSSSRWSILLEGIQAACNIKKNIFQKFFIKGKDWFRNLIMKIK